MSKYMRLQKFCPFCKQSPCLHDLDTRWEPEGDLGHDPRFAEVAADDLGIWRIQRKAVGRAVADTGLAEAAPAKTGALLPSPGMEREGE